MFARFITNFSVKAVNSNKVPKRYFTLETYVRFTFTIGFG